MARVSNTLIGKSYGKVGNAVFSVWKGINVLKEKGLPTNPQTVPQMTQRMIFALFVAVYQLLAPVFKFGFRQGAVKMSEFNAFIAEQFAEEAYSGAYPAITVDYSKLKASKGTMFPTDMTAFTASAGAGTIIITFPNTSLPDQAPNDQFAAAIYNVDRGTWQGSIGDADRFDGTITIDLPAGTIATDDLWVYTFFVQISSGIVSDSTANLVVVAA